MQLIKYIIIFLPIILVFVLLFIGLIAMGYQETKEFFVMIPLSIILTIFYNIFLFLLLIRTNTEVISQTITHYSLVSTKFSNVTDGSFFLGTGTIDDKEYIYYVIREGDELIRDKTSNYKIYIIECEPYAEIERLAVRETFQNWLYNINDIEEKIDDKKGQCIFYVPENSIVQNININ